MCYGWASLIERKIFKSSPTVVSCDTSFDTNKEEFTLLLLIRKSSNNKTFTMPCAPLPNQQKGIFWWVFCSLLPSINNKNNLSRIKLFITDDDVQEVVLLNNVIDLLSPTSVRVVIWIAYCMSKLEKYSTAQGNI